jgi:uncharacterized small protein (TIGR04563 family)
LTPFDGNVVASPSSALPGTQAPEGVTEEKDKGRMAGTDKRKQSLYFPETMLEDIQHEAARLDRSLSWIVQRCVKIGLSEIRKLPSVNDIPDSSDDSDG